MSVNGLVVLLEEVDFIGSVHVRLSVKTTDFRDVVKWDSHNNLQLSGWHVAVGDTFSDRVLDLKTRIQLQKEEIISVSVVQILDCSSSNVTNVLGQTLCSFFHLLESLGLGNDRRTFLENLLETTLSRTITTIQSNGISVLITNNLNFQVTCVLTKLHNEDRRTDDFVLDLDVGIREVVFVINESDALTTSSLGGLNHDTVFVSNATSGFEGFFDIASSSLLEGLSRDGSFCGELSNERAVIWSTERTTPWDGWNLGGLGQNVGSDLVTKNTHDGGSRSDESNTVFIQVFWKIWVLRSMTPTGPNSINFVFDGELGDKIDVGIVISVHTSCNFNERISQADEFGIGLDIFR
mmetsp:Transcript_17316/g.42293  ORF Transcript_17316/g.42293 Transcript_17316/m.42293 type:complete len:351 (+) Transcript_17316:3880-4932(+)